ncbi:hypothetical protein, partial [Mycolicibacterium sp.]|uniref:hypothetical protein n=1 Tax=Mycolicibacterium sp. TaxID=2320850 RepID=UPI00355E40CF
MVLGDSIPDLIASGEMQQAEDYLCAMLKGRGIYVRNRDCPVQAVGALVIGESDMSGRGVLTDLSEGDRTQVFTRTSIMSSTGAAASATTPGDLVIGTNQMAADGAYNAAANFGIELGIAAGYEAGPNSGKRLVISKTAKGSTYNAVLNANGANDPGASFTWDTSTTPFTVVLAGLAVREWFRINAAMRLQGIGAPLLVVFNSLTKNDGKNTVYTGEASDYLALRQRLKSFILSWTNTPAANIDWIELGCPSTFEGSDATAVAAIQTALADFAAADDTVQIVSTEDWPFLADGIHWTSQTIYDAGKAMAALADKLAA